MSVRRGRLQWVVGGSAGHALFFVFSLMGNACMRALIIGPGRHATVATGGEGKVIFPGGWERVPKTNEMALGLYVDSK